jgi:hypothetical protein
LASDVVPYLECRLVILAAEELPKFPSFTSLC